MNDRPIADTLAGMGEQPPIPAPNAQAGGADLYCLQCDYALRGLSGDPCRCPECGVLNPVEDFPVPDTFVREHLRQLKTTPMLCLVVCLFGIVLAAPILVAGFIVSRAFLLVAIIFPSLWVYGMLKFRSSCRARLGWASAFLLYQVVVLLLCTFVAGQLDGILRQWGFRNQSLAVMAVFLAGLVLNCLFLSRGLDWLGRLLDPLFKTEALHRARNELRKQKGQALMLAEASSKKMSEFDVASCGGEN